MRCASTPGFTLFRRSSSRVANPTTQGVTLRGVSGSGASRTLVLADGMPLNDPFGSWVYWNRIPLAAVDRVEVVRGATGDLYGAGALGGVDPGADRAAEPHAGARDDRRRIARHVPRLAVRRRRRRTAGTRAAPTRACAPTARSCSLRKCAARSTRAPTAITRPASRRSASAATTGTSTARGAGYTEDRGNGTVVQVNTTDWQQFSLDVGGFVGGGVFELHGVGSSQDYYQTFSAVAAGRATERLTFEQTIDTSHRGVNAQWTRPIDKLTMIVGADYRHTHALQDELRYALVTGVNTRTGPFVVRRHRERRGRVRPRQHRGDRRLHVRVRRPRRLVEVGARGCRRCRPRT